MFARTVSLRLKPTRSAQDPEYGIRRHSKGASLECDQLDYSRGRRRQGRLRRCSSINWWWLSAPPLFFRKIRSLQRAHAPRVHVGTILIEKRPQITQTFRLLRGTGT